MTRLGIAAGANPLTFAGLAGIGDVDRDLRLARCRATTGSARSSRRAGRGPTSRPTLPGVAEGAYTVDAALGLADRLGVEMPIAREVHDALFEGKSVQRCLVDLLARESKDELADSTDGWRGSRGDASGLGLAVRKSAAPSPVRLLTMGGGMQSMSTPHAGDCPATDSNR